MMCSDPAIREAFSDPETSKIFKKIEEDPTVLGEYTGNVKVQRSLRLIYDMLQKHMPTSHPPQQSQVTEGEGGQGQRHAFAQHVLQNFPSLDGEGSQIQQIFQQFAGGMSQSIIPALQGSLSQNGHPSPTESGLQSLSDSLNGLAQYIPNGQNLNIPNGQTPNGDTINADTFFEHNTNGHPLSNLPDRETFLSTSPRGGHPPIPLPMRESPRSLTRTPESSFSELPPRNGNDENQVSVLPPKPKKKPPN